VPAATLRLLNLLTLLAWPLLVWLALTQPRWQGLFWLLALLFGLRWLQLRHNLMMNKEEIYQEVTSLLTSLFEIAPEDIHPEARLYEDLELDSIDAVDMVVHLQKRTGRKIKPETFRAVRTVQDVVDAVEQLMREDA